MARSQVAVSFSRDSARTAHARVQLKLGALAYADGRHGADASPEFSAAAVASTCALAARYYASLTGGDAILRQPLIRPELAGEIARLRLSCLSYAAARHGTDSCIELARDALGGLCAAAIALCQAALGDDPQKSRVVDPTLQLEGGS